MLYSAFIGLDVHARSISAAALDPMEGTIESKRFGYSPSELASWIREIEFDHAPDALAFDLYISEVRHAEAHKKLLEREVTKLAAAPRWAGRIDALRCLKGIEVVTAFTLTVEAGVFSRFDTAKAFYSYLGLTPSEHSSGARHVNGGITKTGNPHARRLLVEAAWHYARASEARKGRPSCEVPLSIENHAARATKRLVRQRRTLRERGKASVVANVATARELACFVWATGRMAEGTM